MVVELLRNDIIDQKDKIENWVKENCSKQFICKQLHCKPETLNKYLGLLGIEYIGRKGYGKREKIKRTYIPLKQYLQQSKDIQSNKIRNKLILEGFKEHKCELCGRSLWNGQPILLELHHLDGDRFNNSIENFQLLCPNCHAQTESYRWKNSKKN